MLKDFFELGPSTALGHGIFRFTSVKTIRPFYLDEKTLIPVGSFFSTLVIDFFEGTMLVNDQFRFILKPIFIMDAK